MAESWPSGTQGTLLRAQRSELVTMDQAARIHELAVTILVRFGFEILRDDVLAAMVRAGFRVEGSRVFFEASVIEEHVEEMRRLAAQERPSADGERGQLTLWVQPYSHRLHDLESDTLILHTEDTLAEMTRLVDTFAEEGVEGSIPGYLLYEPAPLQPITQYRIAATNARNGAYPIDPCSPITASYVLDMAEAMGHPIRGLPVYLPGNLRLGGQSLDIALAQAYRLERLSVGTMPAAGADAPILPMAAFAIGIAGQLGGLVTLRTVTKKPVSFHPFITPFDLRSMAMVYGSPENLLFHLAAADLNRFYGNTGVFGKSNISDVRQLHAPTLEGNIHEMAKFPGPQSAAEKAAIMAVTALLGARRFASAGALSLDEIFSPEQLLLDVEIRDWVQRLVSGLDTTIPGDELLDEIEAYQDRGYMGADSTLDNYGRLYWYPRLFERDFLGHWEQAGARRWRDRVQEEIRERLARHSYRLDDVRRRDLERIEAAARAHVASL